MAPSYIDSALKGKNLENLTSTTQIYKARATYRMNKRGAMTEIQMLLGLVHQEKYLYWSRNKDSSDMVVDIFWTVAAWTNIITHLGNTTTNRYILLT